MKKSKVLVNKLINDYRDLEMNEIKKKHNISRSTIINILKRLGIYKPIVIPGGLPHKSKCLCLACQSTLVNLDQTNPLRHYKEVKPDYSGPSVKITRIQEHMNYEEAYGNP